MKNDGTMVNAFVPGQGNLSAEEARMVERRQKLLGPAYRLFYQHPLHLMRGEDVWLHAADGRKYLDAYNNVASVGHCHPHVVAAIQAYRAELASKYNTSYERHMKDLQDIRDKALAAGAFAAAVQAEYRRGQALGTIYVERKEIRHGTIDSMSKEEVQRKLDELKRLYGGPPPTALIDATTGEVLASTDREKDPAFDAGVPDPPLDVFEIDRDDDDT